MRLRAALIAVALALASTASAQNLRSLPLATSTTGGNDALLTLVSDSAYRTRAMTLVQFRKALSVTAFDSLITTKLNLTSATVTGAPTWSSLQTFATGQRVDSATGAARAQKLTTARTIAATGDVTYTSPSFDGSGNVTATATVNAAPAGTLTGAALAAGITSSSLTSFGTNARTDSATGAARSQTLTTARALWGQNFDGSAALTAALTGANGSAAAPQYSYTNSTGLGTYRFGADTLGFATLGMHSLRLSGGASATLAGGAGNMVILAGTGNSRTLTLQNTNGSGTPVNALTLNGSLALFAGIVGTANGTVSAPAWSFSGGSTGFYQATLGDTLSVANSGGNTANFCCSTSGGPKWFGGAGNLTILAGTGNSRTMTLQSTNSSGTATTFLTGSVAQAQAANGTAALPSWTFANSSTTGLYRFGADTIGVAIAGTNALQIPALGSIVGGAGNMTLTAGTGNSRTMTLQTTTSAGTAKNTVVLGADTSATFLGAGTFAGALTSGALTATSGAFNADITNSSTGNREIVTTSTTTGSQNIVTFRAKRGDQANGFARLYLQTASTNDWSVGTRAGDSKLYVWDETAGALALTFTPTTFAASFAGAVVPNADNTLDLGTASLRWKELYINPAASGVGDTYICLSTGQQVHAGATCAASTLKMKDSVVAYTNADAILKLRPVTFNFKAGYYGQRAEIGLIAEEAALVDPRFVFKATKYDTLSAVAPTITLNALTQKLDTAAVVIKPGEPEALNVSSIVAALVAQVQVQKRQLDSLSGVVFALQAKLP